MKLDHPFFLKHPNFESAQEAFKERNAQAWVDAWGDFDKMFGNHFQQLVNVCIDADWSDGVSAMKEATHDKQCGWIWKHTTDVVRNPDVPLSRALQHAKPTVVRLLLADTPPLYLSKCLAVGAPSEKRALTMTRARVRSLNAVSKHINQYNQDDKNDLLKMSFLHTVLNIPDFSVVSSLLHPFGNNQIWRTLMLDAQIAHSHQNKVDLTAFLMETHHRNYRYFDILWQHTSFQTLHEDIRDLLKSISEHPQAAEKTPHIASSFNRAIIQEAIDGVQKTNKRKKMM